MSTHEQRVEAAAENCKANGNKPRMVWDSVRVFLAKLVLQAKPHLEKNNVNQIGYADKPTVIFVFNNEASANEFVDSINFVQKNLTATTAVQELLDSPEGKRAITIGRPQVT